MQMRNRVSSIKYLDLFIDENLKWVTHINYIDTSLRKFVYVKKSLKSILNFKLKKLTYFTLIQSNLSYGMSFWGGTYHTHYKNLETTLNSLIKFIFKKPTLLPTIKLFYS